MAKRSLSDFNVNSEQPTKKFFLNYGLPAAPDELSPTEPSERFNFVTESDVKALSTAIPPKMTISSTTWAVRNLNEWLKSLPHNTNHWLSYYVNETRNCKGDLYPPRTLYLLLSGLLRHARSLNTIMLPTSLTNLSQFLNPCMQYWIIYSNRYEKKV